MKQRKKNKTRVRKAKGNRMNSRHPANISLSQARKNMVALLWSKLSPFWKNSIISGLILAFLVWAVPFTYNYVRGFRPNTFIYAYGQDTAYSTLEMKAGIPVLKQTIHVVKFPEGVTNLPDADLLYKGRQWTYPAFTKIYTVVAVNRGKRIDKNIKVKIAFDEIIDTLEITHKNRIAIIEGGAKGSFVVVKIDELLPEERQDFEIIIRSERVKELEAWSSETEKIENIFILDLFIEPEERYLRRGNKQAIRAPNNN